MSCSFAAGFCFTQVDPTGVSKVLELDDREATLLSAMIKSGSWLLPGIADQWLDVELEGSPDSSNGLVTQYKVRPGWGDVGSVAHSCGKCGSGV